MMFDDDFDEPEDLFDQDLEDIETFLLLLEDEAFFEEQERISRDNRPADKDSSCSSVLLVIFCFVAAIVICSLAIGY